MIIGGNAMPWCPKCRNEYYEGFTVCADCGCELVDELSDEKVEEQGGLLSDEDKMRIMSIQTMKELKESQDLLEELLEDTDEEPAENEKRVEYKGTYRNYKEKAEDNKSSAVTLLSFGIVGFAVIVLAALDIISFPLASSSKVIIYGVMGTMFLMFIIMGFVSAKNAKKYAKEANIEDNLSSEIRKWCDENMTKDFIDKGLFAEDEADFSEEAKYFKRFERMKEMISNRFMNLEEDYLNRFIDEYYQEVF